MNIFYLSGDPRLCAIYMVDRHVINMILETAQILSTAHRVLDGKETVIINNGRKQKIWELNDSRENILYKATHINHPSAKWARASTDNYNWLYDHFRELLKEYKYRYYKDHKSEKLISALRFAPKNISQNKFTQPPCAMDEQYIVSNCPIINYRNYYKNGKTHLHSWKFREKPKWMEE